MIRADIALTPLAPLVEFEKHNDTLGPLRNLRIPTISDASAVADAAPACCACNDEMGRPTDAWAEISMVISRERGMLFHEFGY